MFITKTCLYNFDPLKPHFYIVKLGFTGVYIFLLLLQNIDCEYSLEPPRRGGSNEYQQSMFWAEIWKISDFYLKTFWWWNFSIYFNRRVFVMCWRSGTFLLWKVIFFLETPVVGIHKKRLGETLQMSTTRYVYFFFLSWRNRKTIMWIFPLIWT